MILLVVGLVAVIVVILIAVFLSIRLGGSDDHDEPETRPGGRDRRPGEDDQWRERGMRDERRAAPARSAGRDGRDHHRSAREPAREYADRGGRGRDHPGRPRGYDEPGPRPGQHGQHNAAPRGEGYDAAPARRSSPGRRPAERPARYDRHRSPRAAADDYPSGDYPPVDVAGGHDYPSGDLPAADYPAIGPSPDDLPQEDFPAGEGPKPRRKPGKQAAPPAAPSAKGRPRQQRGKRDDEWAAASSTEWESLSDEQYWAELSADKPLASMSRPRQSAGGAKATSSKATPLARAVLDTPAPGSRSGGRSKPAQAARPTPPAARPAPAPAARPTPAAASRGKPGPAGAAPGRGPSGRSQRAPQREAMTEQLPVRPRAHELPAARAAMDPAARRSAPAGHPRPAGAIPAMLGGPSIPLSSPPPGALDDDPLTSPSFSAIPASDSRSYNNARKHARTGAGNGMGRGTGRGPGGEGAHAGASYAGPAHGYHSSPPPAPAPATPPGGWRAAPVEQLHPPSAYGDPYGSRPAAGHANGHAAYGAGQTAPQYEDYATGPAHGYRQPGYQAPAAVPYPQPAAVPYQGQAVMGGPAQQFDGAGQAHYPGAYPGQMPHAGGHQGAAPYEDGYGAAGYRPSYDGGYGADPYGGGYDGYQAQG